MKSHPHKYERRIHFHETDLMGVVHHANYVRFFEEARVHWLNQTSVGKWHLPEGEYCLAVLTSQVEHLLPLRFNERIEVHFQMRYQGLRFEFQYKILSLDQEKMPVVAKGVTTLVALDRQLKITRKLPKDVLAILEAEPWIETWL